MKIQRVIVVLALMLCVAIPAAAEMSREEAMKLAQQYQAQSAAPAEQPPEPIELTEKDVTGFIGAIEELQELEGDARLEADKTGKLEMSEALAANDQAMSILQRHGFGLERFQQVVYSVGYAMAALQMKGNEVEFDQAMAAQEKALEQMRGKLTQEQINMIRSQTGMAKAAMHQIEEQPAGNLALVEKHMDEIRRVVESADRRD